MAEPDVDVIIDDALSHLWGVVNQLSKLQPRRTEYRVSIFGSARLQPGSETYLKVKELARRLASAGCSIVTGGGPGLMQAANEGESLGDTQGARRSYGIRVELPFEQGANPFVDEAHLHGTFFSRLHHFVRLSHAFIVCDGGIGTTLEALMVWQLLQVKHLTGIPLIFLGPMWHGLVDWARASMLTTTPPLANPADLAIPLCVDTIDEAVRVIEEDVTKWRARP